MKRVCRCVNARRSGSARPDHREPVELPERVNKRWSMDFISDVLSSGTLFRILNIVADFSRECPANEVDTSLLGTRVVRVMEHLMETRGLPKAIVVDTGPELSKQGTRRMGLPQHRAATLHRTGQANLRKHRTKSMRLQRRAGQAPHRSFSRMSYPM